MPYAPLNNRSLIALSGDDTLPFLQGLVSNDVLRLPQTGIVYAALLTPQGKFLHDFFILAQDDKVLIDCENDRRSELMQRLLKYRLRSKVTLETVDDLSVSALWNEPPPTGRGITFFPDPRISALGWRILSKSEELTASFTQVNEEDYDLHRLTLGVPEGGRDLIPEKSFLLPFGFEDLHGVDFNKGCYVGQEVTARSKHRGQLRKYIYQVTGSQKDLPAAGTPIYCNDTLVGEMHSSRGSIGLAVLNRDEVEKAHALHINLRCGDQLLKERLPDWVKAL